MFRETYFRLDLEWCDKENTILYRWNDFANDFTFTNVQQWHVAYDNLTSLWLHITNTPRIKYSGTISVPFLLGLTCKENVEWLRGFISQHIPSFFQLERTLFRADCQRDNILKQAKWKVKELQEDLYFEDSHNKGIIREGLPIVADGWQGSNEIVQALGVKLMESQNWVRETKNELKVTKKRLHRSLDTVHRLKIQKENESDFLRFVLIYKLLSFLNLMYILI